MITYEQAQRLNDSELEAKQRASAAALRQLDRSSPTYRGERTGLERAIRILARVTRERGMRR
ncbi:hypothetical protein [Curtobacterium sp. 24E2]|nr:hypothetical protein JN350_09285 [Curtobacterium sp. 24E2]